MYQGGLVCDRNQGCQIERSLSIRILQNFELLNRLSLMNQIFDMGKYQK